jgi:hypothetical protein
MSKCEICGSEFAQVNKYRTVRTCSTECGKKLRAQNMRASYEARGTWTTEICPVCGNEFKHRHTKAQRTCSVECRGRLAAQEARVASTCTVCGKQFDHYARQDRNTCSVKCAAIARSSGVHYPECKVCGVSTGSYNRIYCNEHRPAKPGIKPLPRKHATCQTCGEEFSRPGSWQGKMMYCSLDCSKQDPSYRRIKRYSFGNLNAEGGYELRFLACLQRLKIDWEAWPDDEPVFYATPDDKQRSYTPDFRVDGMAVEVKGWIENPDSTQHYAHEQWDRAEPLILVGRESLAELERIFNRDQFLQILHEDITSD